MSITEEKYNLFKPEVKYTFNKKKEDFEYFSLTTGSAQNLNNPTGSLVVEINSTDAYLDLPNTCIVAKIKINVAANKNITVENNFFPFLFNQMVLQLNGNAFQTADEPGELDTAYKLLMLNKNYKDTEGCLNAWYPDTHSGQFVNQLTVSNPATNDELIAIVNRLNIESINKGYQYRKKYYTPATGDNIFYIKFPLKPLFSFMDHESFSTQFKWSFKFVKDVNKGRIFYGVTGSTDADVTLTIEEFRIQIPKITPSAHIEPKLIKQTTSGKKAKASVLDRKSYSLNIGNESKFEWEITKVSNNPRYVCVQFKDQSIADNILQNNSKYVVYKDNDNHILRLQLHADNVRYPIDPIIFFENGERNNHMSYEYYVKLTNTFGNISPLDRDDYNNIYPLICFDLSASEEILKKNGVDVKLIIHKKGLNNIMARAFIFEDNTYSLDYEAGRIISET